MAKAGEEWAAFRAWLHSIQVVTFDLELGQVIENTYPAPDLAGADPLSEQDRTNICYLAFPDSNSGVMGDTQFHFRIRRTGPRQGLQRLHKDYNARLHLLLRPWLGWQQPTNVSTMTC